MPRMNGIDMSREIKSINKNVPIVIISAHRDASFLLETIEIGINGYLLKPVNRDKLLETLENNIKTIFLEKELREKKEQSLHQSRFALLGEMISMIAHQWRQPLNVVAVSIAGLRMKFELNKDNLNTIEEKEKFENKIELQLSKIEEYAVLLSSIIDDFRKLYKSSNEKSSVSINNIIKDVIQNLKKTDKNLLVQEHFNSKKEFPIYKNELEQICTNILNNATENFISKDIKNPIIDISTNDYENGIEFTILDNGGGVEPEKLDKIFDPYYSTKKDKNGKGLGLYTVKIIIQEHLNGEIFVENKNDGLEFKIRIKEEF